MIDTITLRLDEYQFKILDHDKFSPNSSNFYYPPYARMGSRGYIDAVQNPTRKEMLEGNYKPQLTLRKRWRTHQPLIYLYVQFSAPKLLYGNNFDEHINSDLEPVLIELKRKLSHMAIIVTLDDLKRAMVTKIHYGKNIVLPDFVIPYMIINEIRKVDFNFQNDLCEKDYKNSGHSVRFHNNEFELIFYDKKKDLQKSKQSEKRAIETDNAIQMNLLDVLQPQKPFEVLRMELRLNTSNKIAHDLGIPKSEQNIVTLFDQVKSCKILTAYWQNVMRSYKFLSCEIGDKERFLASFMANNPRTRLGNALSVYAFVEYIKELGVSKFRNLIEKKYSRRTWYAFKSSVGKYDLNTQMPSYFDAISKAVSEYKPLRLADYKDSL